METVFRVRRGQLVLNSVALVVLIWLGSLFLNKINSGSYEAFDLIFVSLIAIAIISRAFNYVRMFSYKVVIKNGKLQEQGFFSPGREIAILSIKTLIGHIGYTKYSVGRTTITVGEMNEFPLFPVDFGFADAVFSMNPEITLDEEALSLVSESTRQRVKANA